MKASSTSELFKYPTRLRLGKSLVSLQEAFCHKICFTKLSYHMIIKRLFEKTKLKMAAASGYPAAKSQGNNQHFLSNGLSLKIGFLVKNINFDERECIFGTEQLIGILEDINIIEMFFDCHSIQQKVIILCLLYASIDIS